MLRPVRFTQRLFPSANLIIIKGEQPIVVDPGFGSDIDRTESLLLEEGVSPRKIQLVINTHYHSDHAGGNHGLQHKYGLTIAAHRWEGQMVNDRHRDACCAEWLNQPVESYHAGVLLAGGEELDTGMARVRVLHTPGHTLGHLSLYLPESRELICGDLIQVNDLGFINIFREGAASLRIYLESLDQVARLALHRIYPGHGPVIEEPGKALDLARKRLDSWLHRPDKLAWHGCKRIFAYALMINRGIDMSNVPGYLLGCSWFKDFSRYVFQLEPEEFIEPLLKEMFRSGACYRENGRLLATAPYNPPGINWPPAAAWPAKWPEYSPAKDEKRTSLTN